MLKSMLFTYIALKESRLYRCLMSGERTPTLWVSSKIGPIALFEP